jgi:spore coat polysaccharide biosynthesis predicted glycosyltransferase SpsG
MLNKIKNSPKKTCIICDIDSKTGLGHFNRMTVLYKELKKQKLNPSFLFNERDSNFIKKYITRVAKFVVPNQVYKKNYDLIDFLKKKKIDIVILDSYKINRKFEKELNNFFFTVAIDDHQKRHFTHIVFNGRQDVKTSVIQNNSNTQWLIGKKYLLFNEVKKKKVSSKTKINKILVHSGGSDAYFNNYKFFKTLFSFVKNLNIKIDMLCAQKETKKKLVKKFLKDLNKKKLNYINYKKNLRETFSSYDLIIGPAGNITFEAISAKTLPLSFPIFNDGRDSILTWNILGNFLHLTYNECKNQNLVKKILYLVFENFQTFNRKFKEISKDTVSGEKEIVRIIKLNLQGRRKSLIRNKENKILIKKTNFSHARSFLIGRNQKKVRSISSNPAHIIKWPEHIKWWNNANIKKFVLAKGDLNLAFHWVKKNYSKEINQDIVISGWFPFDYNDKNNLKYSKFTLDHQINFIKNRYKGSVWIIIISKKNLVSLRMNRYAGFLNATTQVKDIAKKIFNMRLSQFNVFQMQI